MKISDNDLIKIVGGSDYISGTIINALVNVIKLLQEAGEGLGSSFRRIASSNTCPLK